MKLIPAQPLTLVALSLMVACDPAASSTSEGNQTDTGDHPSSITGETTSGSEGMADSSEPGGALPPNFALSTATVIGSLCEGAGEKGKGKQTIIITNERPDQPINYFQVTFDELSVSSVADQQRGGCTVNIFAEWTPGHRLIVDSFQLDGVTSTKNQTDDGLAKLGLQVRSGYASSISRARTFSGTEDEDYRETFDSGAEKVYSSCTGFGVFSFKMQLDINVDDQGEGLATIDQVSALFRIAEPGEAPSC